MQREPAILVCKCASLLPSSIYQQQLCCTARFERYQVKAINCTQCQKRVGSVQLLKGQAAAVAEALPAQRLPDMPTLPLMSVPAARLHKLHSAAAGRCQWLEFLVWCSTVPCSHT